LRAAHVEFDGTCRLCRRLENKVSEEKYQHRNETGHGYSDYSLDPHVFSFKLSDNFSLSRVPSPEDQRRRRQTESVGPDGTA
jgi:hypothetical protein